MKTLNETSIRELGSVDVKKIRTKTRMSQKEFCSTFGLNLNTLRHWERGDRIPQGSALILLNMIDKSPEEVYAILASKKESNLDIQNNKNVLKKIIFSKNYPTFNDLKSLDASNFELAILALIEANGFPYKKIERENNNIIFFAGHEPKNLKKVLKFNIIKSETDGELKNVIEKTYLIISLIENKLTDLVYLPPEMRREEISKILQELDIDENFYSNILKNW
ncbi:helix-turn-helix domain-containing protein [Acinetobacter baumannii]